MATPKSDSAAQYVSLARQTGLDLERVDVIWWGDSMKLKLKQNPSSQTKEQEQKYPEPDQIERLFEAWQKGGKEALLKELQDKK